VFDIIHPTRRNLTAIRGYVRLGGLPDDPRTDPQDRSWYGPHDRLFLPEESDEMDFKPGPEFGAYTSCSVLFHLTLTIHPTVWCWGWDGAGDLDGPDVDPIWEHMLPKSFRPEAVAIEHDRSMKL
jgi:alpha-1,3-mannosyltransferase